MRIIVNELLHLWKEGVIVKTHKYPLGQLVRLILVALVCDKPAAHKLGGFGSYSHCFFCTHCWVEQQYKVTPAAFEKNGRALLSQYIIIMLNWPLGFQPHTNEEHWEAQHQYQLLELCVYNSYGMIYLHISAFRHYYVTCYVILCGSSHFVSSSTMKLRCEFPLLYSLYIQLISIIGFYSRYSTY